MRLSLIFLFAALAVAQNSGTETSATPAQEPALPVIDENACPFEGCTFKEWKVTKDSPLYSSWQDDRTQTGKLKKGEQVLGLTGIHITRKPDRILVKRPIPDLSLKPGDIILRYMYVGEGFANIWVKGVWHKEYDCSFIAARPGFGCTKDCAAEVIEQGVKEWWVRVTTASGQTGWTLADHNFDGMDILAGIPVDKEGHNGGRRPPIHSQPNLYCISPRLDSRGFSNSSPFSQPISFC